MALNKELVLRVADAIEKESTSGPLGFDMDDYVEQSSCGTTACIAGWAVFLTDAERDVKKLSDMYSDSSDEFREGRAGDLMVLGPRAADLLGLSTDDAIILFHETFADRESAVKCLRNLVATGKVDWEAA